MGILQTMCFFYFSGMTIFLIICTVFPNALNLRPTVFPRDNMFTDMVKVLYKTDTPTNVLPSIHVFNSIGAGIAISHSNDFKKNTVDSDQRLHSGCTYHSVHNVLKAAFRDRCDCSSYTGMHYLSIRICCSRQEST